MNIITIKINYLKLKIMYLKLIFWMPYNQLAYLTVGLVPLALTEQVSSGHASSCLPRFSSLLNFFYILISFVLQKYCVHTTSQNRLVKEGRTVSTMFTSPLFIKLFTVRLCYFNLKTYSLELPYKLTLYFGCFCRLDFSF